MSLAAEVRAACAAIAATSRHVWIDTGAIPAYARSLGEPEPYPPPVVTIDGSAEERAAFHLALDAINFGSGWFPTLRKRRGRSGFFTIALALRDRGPMSARELRSLDAAEVATMTGQDPAHPLMTLYAGHLAELGRRAEAAGSFLAIVTPPGLAERLAGWPTFSDPPFYKRAQITAYDMACASLIARGTEGDLTMFADNLVPHVLRVDEVLRYDPALAQRIDAGELLEHGSAEEREIRAAGLHAVELIVAARPGLSAPAVDHLLWSRGQRARYKAIPRHRARCTAY